MGLRQVMQGQTEDKDAHKHSFFKGVDLSEYTGRNDKCHGGSWADYLVVNVTLKAVLDKNPVLASEFWSTAHLFPEADLERSPTIWSFLLSFPLRALALGCPFERKGLEIKARVVQNKRVSNA